ncbi:MAG: hypothetical protein GY862_37205, partial [Gammaproteobacteria bacterium]|nr:hypothetical protein [Gammaproteobacteria bacterium]
GAGTIYHQTPWKRWVLVDNTDNVYAANTLIPDAVVNAAKKHKLLLIEDCAHALGTRYKNQSAGTFGDASFFSFELTKPVNTFGGGMIVTDNAKLAENIRAKMTQREEPGLQLTKKVIFALIEEGVVRSPIFPLVAYLFYYEWTQKLISALFFAFHGQTRMKQYRYANFQAYLGRQWM